MPESQYNADQIQISYSGKEIIKQCLKSPCK